MIPGSCRYRSATSRYSVAARSRPVAATQPALTRDVAGSSAPTGKGVIPGAHH